MTVRSRSSGGVCLSESESYLTAITLWAISADDNLFRFIIIIVVFVPVVVVVETNLETIFAWNIKIFFSGGNIPTAEGFTQSNLIQNIDMLG